MDTKYKNSVRYLESLIPGKESKERVYELDRIRRLLDLIGNPESSFKSIHIGGTSGKGSTAYMAAAILKEAGYKVGLHISPHLERINERMQIDERPIGDIEFAKFVNLLKPYVKKVEKEGLGMPTYFEVLVALSFQYFKRKKVDIAVVEVGLGGALDATNVLNPEVAVITNVDLDHTEILGNTVERIVRDKAGIIKEGIEVVTAARQKSVLEIIKKRCKGKHAQLTIIGRNPKVPPLRPLGEHQKINAACAVAAIAKLQNCKLQIKKSAVRKALAKVEIPGRLEIVNLQSACLPVRQAICNHPIILDGAHNPAKMKSLVAALKNLFPKKKFVFLFAAKKGKDAEAMLRLLAPLAEKFYFTRFQTTTDFGKNQSVSPQELARTIKRLRPSQPLEICKTPEQALHMAIANLQTYKLINLQLVVTGSLYLVGEVRSIIKP
ncbi:MAG: folylpolyglutamate synthase/dihydrofolate synthase family protein [Patescibacteria group bacterium]